MNSLEGSDPPFQGQLVVSADSAVAAITVPVSAGQLRMFRFEDGEEAGTRHRGESERKPIRATRTDILPGRHEAA